MTFRGITGAGDELPLGDPVSAVLSSDRDAPADLLRAVFPADGIWEELREVRMTEQGETVFQGIVDEQNTSLTSSGVSVELICRSKEALLLDNEAAPETIVSPSLESLEERLIRPLGLRLGPGDRQRKRGRLTVKKGESCWSVLERFCREYLGTEPFVEPDGTVNCLGRTGTCLTLDRVISARTELSPCKRIGQVWVQSCRGTYDTLYRGGDPTVLRRRYVSAESGIDPRKLLKQGDRESFLLTVTCAGARWPGKNGTVTVTVPRLGTYRNCPVRSVRCRRDDSGETTSLTLERPEKEETVCG